MLNITFMKHIKKNNAGFTLLELIIAMIMSVAILGLLAHVFRGQQKEFSTQTGLNTMQANGRAATEFIARSVQNAGFNVTRGTRFLAASDHYITAVYDADNNDVIENDEVITYTIANPISTTDESFSFVARFDVDGDGVIQSTENPTMTVDMTTTAPPFNLYKVVPDSAGTGIERSLVARNIDNMTIRYYDRNGNLLPVMKDTDNDGIGDVAFDADLDGVPDDGNWTFKFPDAELNDIRKVEILLLARSRESSPRETYSTGTYLQGSLAAVTSGSTAYSDKYMREDFTARMAPRNLVMAPWGSVAMRSAPAVVGCPSASTVTATLLDANGDAISGETINFTATGGATTTLGTPSPTSDSSGEGSTTLTYDYAAPYYTSTISASALVDDGSGELKPIYNAAPVGFSFSTQGGFVDAFDSAQPVPWTDLVPGTGFDIPPGQEYFTSTQPEDTPVGSLNGCVNWQDYVIQTNITQTEFLDSNYYAIIFRHQDQDNYYYVRVRYVFGSYWLEVGNRNGVNYTSLPGAFPKDLTAFSTIPAITYDPTPTSIYTLKVQVVGSDIKAKIWKPADPSDPGADEPAGWEMEVTDATYASGQFGVEASDEVFQFDNVSLENPPGT